MENKVNALEIFKVIAAQLGRLCGLLVKHDILTKEEAIWIINGDDDDQVNTPKAKDKEVKDGEDG